MKRQLEAYCAHLRNERQVSEHTSQMVDQEVKRILDDAHERARAVLRTDGAPPHGSLRHYQ